MLLGGELHRQRDDGLGLLLERTLEKGVARLAELQRAVRRHHRHAGDEVQGGLGLGHDEIYFSKEGRRLYEFRHIRTEELAELVQDAGNLTGLVETQFADLILHLDDLDRLDEDGLAGSGLVMDESLEPALGGRRDGYEELAVADVDGGVGLDYAILLSLAEYRRGPAGDGGLLVLQAFAYIIESIGRRVLHLAVTVYDRVYPLLYVAETAHARSHPLEVGIDAVLHAGEERGHLGQRPDHGPEFADR